MTWTIMMTQKELCIKPYGFLVSISNAIAKTSAGTDSEIRKSNQNLLVIFLYNMDKIGFKTR